MNGLDPLGASSTSPRSDGAPPLGLAQLQRQAVRGSAFALANQMVKLGVNLVTTVVMAVHLGPGDFGLVAVAFAMLSLLTVFRDAGLASALIRERDTSELHINSVFWTGLAFSVPLAGALVVSAAPLSRFYGQTELAPIIAVMAVPLLAQALAAPHEAQLRKSLRFDRIMIADAGSTMLASGVAILALVLGAQLWSLVLRVALGPVVMAIACMGLFPWRPRWNFSLSVVRSLWSFGAYLLLTSLVAFVGSRLDSLIIAKLLGVAGAGTFFMARNLTLTPIQEITGAVGGVMFPVFSAVQHDTAVIKSGYLTGTRYLALIIFPLMAGFIAVGPDAVALIFGESWADTIPVLQIIALHGIFYCLNNPASQILYARGRSKIQFAYSLVIATVAVSSFIIGARWGIVGVAASWTVSLFIVAPSVLWFAGREIGLGFAEALFNVARPAAGAGLAASAVVLLAVLWRGAGWPISYGLLSAEIALGLVVYAALCALLVPGALRKLRRDLGPAL